MSLGRETFPIKILEAEARQVQNPPLSVPLVWLLPHDAAFQERHGQTLAVLAARGGCDPREIWAALHYRGSVADISLRGALAWIDTRPWEPRSLEAECLVCGGTFKAEAVGDQPDVALVAARTTWWNAHHPSCGFGLRPLEFDAGRWPYTRLRVTFEIGVPTR